MRLLKAFFILCGLMAGSAMATTNYDFAYTATSGTINSFNFTLTTPGFITTAGASPAFDAFTIGDGTNSWSMTQDLTGFSAPTTGVFCFATSGALLGPNCTASFHPPDGVLTISFLAGFPSAPGVYPSNFGGAFYLPNADQALINLGTGTLILTIDEVSEVPEPGSVWLVTVGAGLLGAVFFQRKMLTRIQP